jgi:hypothetical protein
MPAVSGVLDRRGFFTAWAALGAARSRRAQMYPRGMAQARGNFRANSHELLFGA